VKDTTWTYVDLVRLSVTGEILAKRNLTKDVWFIDLATVPSDLVPRGQAEVMNNVINSR
jgi:hypothetical protein